MDTVSIYHQMIFHISVFHQIDMKNNIRGYTDEVIAINKCAE